MDQEWVPLTIALVKYPKGDLIGKLFAYYSLLPFAIIVSYVTLIIFNRDLKVIVMFIGQLLNESICLILKNIIKQERPDHSEIYKKIYGKPNHGFGMPSQHSQFQSYFTIFSVLYILKINLKPRLFKFFLIFSLLSSTLVMVYARIYLIYHSIDQCLIGLFIGSFIALLWFRFVYSKIVQDILKKVSQSEIGKLFQLVYDIKIKTK